MTFHIFVNFLIILFSYGKVKDKDVFLIMIKFCLGRAKGRGKRGYGGEALNEGYFCKIPIIKQDTNFISQTSNHHHCNWHGQKPICKDF